MTVAMIVQARMGSTRLPGKILKSIGNETLLEFLLTRLKKSKKTNVIIIATTTNPKDEIVEKVSLKAGVKSYRGSEDDILDRYYHAARQNGIKSGDIIVRVTSDCPFSDPEIIDQVIDLIEKEKVDYASNNMMHSYPHGLDVEAFTFDALERAWNETNDETNPKNAYNREHVTPWIRDYGPNFTKKNLRYPEYLTYIRITVDNPEDYEVILKLWEKLEKRNDFNLNDIIRVVKENPGILKINEKHLFQGFTKKALEQEDNPLAKEQLKKL